ncbi:flippase [Fundidesulfovibrio butyratiphilus]
MSQAKSFVSALAGQWAATLYSAVVATGLSFALGRVLGPEAFGGYNAWLTAASLFAIAQDGGFSPLIFRETARPTPGFVPGPLLGLGLGHLLAVTGAGALLLLVVPVGDKLAGFLALGYYALFCAGNYLSASLKGQGRFPGEARWRMAVRTLTAVGVGGALFLPGAGPAAIFAGMLAGQALALALPMAGGLRVRPSFHLGKTLYRHCGSFLIITAATTIYFKSDILLLGWLTGDNAQVGQYAAAYRLVEAAVLFATPLTHLFFRRLRLSLTQPADFKRSFRLMLGVMTGLGLVGSGLAVLLGPWIITLAFGHRYEPAGDLCPWLLPALAFLMPNGVLTQALVAMGRERAYARLTVLTALVNVGLNVLLIPHLGVKGSALSTVATEALLTAGLGLCYMRKSPS